MKKMSYLLQLIFVLSVFPLSSWADDVRGKTILKNYSFNATNTQLGKELSHHSNNSSSRFDINGTLTDYLPNSLARYYNTQTKQAEKRTSQAPTAGTNEKDTPTHADAQGQANWGGEWSGIRLEGLIWSNRPMYIEPNFGQGYRLGDEEGWASGNGFDCTDSRIHVWDSPEEALADPEGAALEINAKGNDPLDLTYYLGIHYVTSNNDGKYELHTLTYGQEAEYGLHYEFEFVDYYLSGNAISDSRYATFSDWTETESHSTFGIEYDIVKDWNKTPSMTGRVMPRTISPDGFTMTISSITATDREPLVRVMVKNEKGDVLLDGYILLHIQNTPNNLIINDYPVFSKEYKGEPLSMQTTWSQFSRYILANGLSGINKAAFDEWYMADCVEGDTGEYPSENGYQLKIFNFGNDVFGNNPIEPAAGNFNSYWEKRNPFENKALGEALYYPNGEGLNNHTFSWTLSKEEVEMLIKDKTGSVPVSRWICFAAKDSRMAPYPYIWVKLTIEITTAKEQQKFYYGEKIRDYWYHWNPNGILDNSQAMNGWSAIVFDIQAPRNGETIKDQKWDSWISQALVANYVKIDGKSKYYFAPKKKEVITVNNRIGRTIGYGIDYYITPQGDSNQTTYNKLFSQSGEQFDWDEATLEDVLNNNSIIYGGEGAGVFNNDILYAVNVNGGQCTPIVRLIQEQDLSQGKGSESTRDAGKLELIRYLPIGSTIEDVRAGRAEENTVLYDVLNAIGYSTFDVRKEDYSQYNINQSMSNMNSQLHAWLGYVKDDGNNVAQYVEQEKYDDDNKATFLVSWQRPINAYMEQFSGKAHEAYLYIIDYLKLYDWRGGKPNQGYMWDDHYWFWAYYNIKEIDFDLRNARTNLHQESDDSWAFLDQVSTPIQLCPIEVKNPATASAQVIPGSGDIGKYPFDLVDANMKYIYAVNNDALKAYMGLNPVAPVNKARFGGIYYKGNDEISESFSIIVPITVKYEWGSVMADFRINIENPNGTKPNTEVQNDLDPIVFDLSAPSSGTTVKDAGWKSTLNNTQAMYFVNTSGKSKAYFAPKGDIKVTAQNSKTYTITPQGDNNKDTYNKLFTQSGGQLTWDEGTLEQTLRNNSIAYEGNGFGAFNNTILYAVDQAGNATPIVRINNEQSSQILELIQRLPDGTENEVLYDVLNAIGYPGDTERQLRAWIGYVGDNGSDVAQYSGMKTNNGNKATFLVSWNRPINLNINEPETIKGEEQYLYLIDYLKPYNWLGDKPGIGYMYDDHYWQWACYNVKEIDVDLRPEKVMTNLRQSSTDKWVSLSSVSTTMQFKTIQIENPGTAEAIVAIGTANLGEYTFDLVGNNIKFTYSVNNDALKAYMGYPALSYYYGVEGNPINKTRFGGIYYNRNGENAKSFSILVPVTVKYEWGSVTTDFQINIENESGSDDNEVITFTTSKGLTYEGNTKTQTATLIGVDSEKTGEVKVPEAVLKDDYSFIVTAIAANAFDGCTQIEKVELPKSIEDFATGALSDCTSLQEIRIIDGGGRFCTVDGVLFSIGNDVLMAYPAAKGNKYEIPTTVTTILDGSFAHAQLTTLTVGWYNPDAIAVDVAAFEGVDFENCELSVPLGMSADYRQHKVWGLFMNVTGKETVIVDGVKYNIKEDGTASFEGPADKSVAGDYVIESPVIFNGVEVPVTEIGDGAFEDCTELTSITIPSTVESIGENAFKGCKNLEDIYCESGVPIDLRKTKRVRTRTGEVITQFDGIDFDKCILYVPIGSKMAYENAEGWNQFKHIVEYDPTGIRDIRLYSNGQDVYYNLQGQRVTNPTKGLYIKNGQKVVVK